LLERGAGLGEFELSGNLFARWTVFLGHRLALLGGDFGATVGHDRAGFELGFRFRQVAVWRGLGIKGKEEVRQRLVR
jgi:hypothetical protein